MSTKQNGDHLSSEKELINAHRQTAPAKKDDPVNPSHYKDLGEFSAVHIIPKWKLGFEVGTALKYIQRAGTKPGEPEIRDLKKAVWYLLRRIYLLDPENEPDPAGAGRDRAPKGN